MTALGAEPRVVVPVLVLESALHQDPRTAASEESKSLPGVGAVVALEEADGSPTAAEVETYFEEVPERVQ